MQDRTPPRIQTLNPRWGENYRAGYLGFVAADASFVSHGIAWFSRDGGPVAVSHALVVTGQDECIEAMPQGVQRNRLQPYFYDDRPLFLLPFVGYTPELAAKVVSNALKLEGLPYGFATIATDALAGTFTGRALNGLCNWLSTETKNKWLANLPNRLVSKLANPDGLHPVCSVVAAECLHPVEPALLKRGLVEVLGPVGCLSCPRIVTPQMLLDDAAVIAR